MEFEMSLSRDLFFRSNKRVLYLPKNWKVKHTEEGEKLGLAICASH